MEIEWIIATNILVWVVLQLGAAWAFTRMPGDWFDRDWTSTNSTGVRIYEQIFRIKVWKDRLPDGATWFAGGVAKSKLGAVNTHAVSIKIRETWRGELCHWTVIGFLPLFVIWNPWWGVLINAFYVIVANLPCILVQKYNRVRLLHLASRLRRIANHGDPHAEHFSDP